MWGDPERAIRLDPADALTTILFQVTGPAHIPWQDQRWQELLHGYNVWVHVERNPHGVVDRACQSLTQHAPRSSNLAAFVMHVTRMMRALLPAELLVGESTASSPTAADNITAFSNRIALVGKARATAGSLNLLRILVHAIISTNSSYASSSSSSPQPSHQLQSDQGYDAYVRDCFRYRSRDSSDHQEEQDVAVDLLQALLNFIQQCHALTGGFGSSSTTTSTVPPEVYDTLTLVLQLILVLLSTQLYRPMRSSFQRIVDAPPAASLHSSSYYYPKLGTTAAAMATNGYFWDILLDQVRRAERSEDSDNNGNNHDHHGDARVHSATTTSTPGFSWTPVGLLLACLEWQMTRPAAPARSIQQHSSQLAAQVVAARGEKMGADGMYENHVVVTACSSSKTGDEGTSSSHHRTDLTAAQQHHHHHHYHGLQAASALLDATKGVLVLSGTIILLPFRLMSLALGLLKASGEKGYDQMHKKQLQSSLVAKGQHASRTKDVLWLTESPVADLASCLLLLLVNNERAAACHNPFRAEMAKLTDERWEEATNHKSHTTAVDNGLPDLPRLSNSDDETEPLMTISSLPPRREHSTDTALAVNFEKVFGMFGSTAHTEVGALLLYTVMQTSPSFAEAIAVRSDLDTIVLPLLRTLYFSSSSRFYAAHDYSSRLKQPKPTNAATGGGSTSNPNSSRKLSIRNCPFRSLSQLYVLVILLLLFSQDSSFGADAFRRVMVQHVPWYKERNLRSISLGSIIILSILRALTFNLSRLMDPFLLSNCCAVLMNLSNAIMELHDYAAMRLLGVTVTCMKRYAELVRENPNDDEEDLTTPTAMHGEVARTLLQVIKHCLSTKNLDRNLHVIYALIYHQTDFKKLVSGKDSPFRKSEISRIQKVLVAASTIVENAGDARTAQKALKALSEHVDEIRQVVSEQRKRGALDDDFTFTYEEEADPEIFFVPYVWETIVCVVTSSSVEWNKDKIQVFPLLEEEEDDNEQVVVEELEPADPTKFSTDVAYVV